jgi:hypothetical protein
MNNAILSAIPSSRRGRAAYSSETIQRLLGEFRLSGLSQAAFCRQNRLPYWRFNSWLRRHQHGPAPSLPHRLIPVAISHPPKPGAIPFEVLLGNHRSVRVPQDFDPAALSRLLATLEA